MESLLQTLVDGMEKQKKEVLAWLLAIEMSMHAAGAAAVLFWNTPPFSKLYAKSNGFLEIFQKIFDIFNRSLLIVSSVFQPSSPPN